MPGSSARKRFLKRHGTVNQELQNENQSMMQGDPNDTVYCCIPGCGQPAVKLGRIINHEQKKVKAVLSYCPKHYGEMAVEFHYASKSKEEKEKIEKEKPVEETIS